MSDIQDSFYARWRVQSGVVSILHEDTESPPERLLQAIWLHQRLLRDQLRTLGGEPVRILHPGFHNLEGGPDFRRAIVQIGDSPPREGDIEVDLRPNGWRAHGHDINPAFKEVVLHVVWDGEGPMPGGLPRLQMRDFLDAPLGELSLWLNWESTRVFPEQLRGKCCAPLKNLSAEERMELLHEAARVRLSSKGALFEARARQVGWEQSLWEGLFRALGYKHNVWPMQRLGELRTRWQPGCTEPGPLQARLLGLSGLLPAELTRTRIGADRYVRGVWDQWWRERNEFSDVILPRSVWRLHGLRPANHPQRRLALAAGWSLLESLPAKLEAWCAEELPKHQMCSSLLKVLQVAGDEFWSWHWTLQSARLGKEQPLLGPTRLADLAVNVVIPWLWIRAVEGKNQQVRRRLDLRYFQWPVAEDNSLLRLARERLLGQNDRRMLPTASAQQGLIQIVRDFCEHSNAVCDGCRLPELVRDFQRERGR